MSKTKKIAILAIIAMVLTMMPAALFAATADDTRLAGEDRIATALEIASAGTWGNTVVLAPADQANLVDSLAAAPLAGQENAPILLTFKNELDARVKAKIVELKASKVYVIGAISDAVKNEVDAIEGVEVEKLSGDSRWETADAINAKLVNPKGTFVVGYNAIPDALSVASFAAANNYAIVLANADGSVPADKLVGDVTYLVGGASVVKDYNGATRLGGADRFATNQAVVTGLAFSFDRVYVANGLSMVDALAASPLAAKYNAPVLLSNGSSVPAGNAVKDKLGMVIALGGTNAVPEAVIEALTGELGAVTVCAVVAKDYDDDTKNQYVDFTVNGKKVSIEALNAAGWDLEFSAGKTKNKIGENDDIFADKTIGLLVDKFGGAGNPDTGDYYVQLTLTKGTDVVISAATKITIKNLNLAATGISDYELYNTNSSLANVKMNSTKLVVGEKYEFKQITVTAGSSKEDIVYATTPFTVKTSDAGIISKSGNEITAQAPGTATITLSYGNASKAISFTVVNDAREAKGIKVKKTDGTVVTSLKIVAATDLKAEVLDQYGDPFSDGFTIENSNTTVLTVTPLTVTPGAGGEFTLTPGKKGTATLTFKSGTVKLGTFVVTVSDDDTVAKTELVLHKVDTNSKFNALPKPIKDLPGVASKDNFSADTTLDISDDNYLLYKVNKLNEAGIVLGTDTLAFDFDDDVVQSKADVLDSTNTGFNSGYLVIAAGTEKGTATVKFKDSYGKLYTIRVTVVNEGYNIKSISLKTPATSDFGKSYKWSAVVNYTSTGNDPIVTGVTLNKAAAQEIRFSPDSYQFYIDKDSSGDLSPGDTLVGYLVITTTGKVAGSNAVTTIGDNGTTTGLTGSSITTQTGDDGTIIFKVFDVNDKVVASKSVKVEL
ncbi:MAG TPA: cell wall-binding repeat-containing protein [Peptococcaceae bacterium]|nr:cell wall-binding repeat-containing protein [Peptococcaceae bacterium]